MAWGWTWLQKAWGENHRLQDGSTGLVSHSQPTNLLAIAEWDSLGGVDLPGFVRRLGSESWCSPLKSARGRSQPGGTEPAT